MSIDAHRQDGVRLSTCELAESQFSIERGGRRTRSFVPQDDTTFGAHSNRRLAHAWRGTVALGIVALLLALAPSIPAAAHPLGNFTVNQYSRLEIGANEASLVYVLDLAELPTVTDRPLLDTNDDGIVDDAERERYLADKLAEIVPGLQLTSGSTELSLQPVARSMALVPGQAGLDTTRIEATFVASLPQGENGTGQLTYRNDYASDRLGWREIVVVNDSDISLDNASELPPDRSNELRLYPDDLLSSPPDERSATISFKIAPGAPAASAEPATIVSSPAGIGMRLEEIVRGGTLSSTSLLLALLAAAGWGALHALSPGHGKTVVGAYLVGSRGTPRHALFLGLTVTITHTAGVIALGLIILFASRTIMPEQLYPWLSLISGLLVAALGLTILRQRVLGLPAFGHHHHHQDHSHAHDHVHDHGHGHVHAHSHDGLVHSHGGHVHSHLPPDIEGERLTWRNLLALGISGGLLPCPSALLALLGAVAVGRAGFGLMIVVAFSLGLAATLTGVGLLFLYAGRFLERRALSGRWYGVIQFAPAVAAVAVTASGIMIIARALVELQML